MRAWKRFFAAAGVAVVTGAACGPKDGEEGAPIPQPVSDYDMVPASGELVGATSEALTAEGVTTLAYNGGGDSWGGKYDRVKAVDYAHRYALSPNPRYAYCGGRVGQTPADCTNFASQALFAGGVPQIRTGDENSGWWSNGGCWSGGSSRSWRSVDELWRYMVNNGYAIVVHDVRDLRPGDLIFYNLRLSDHNGDYVCDTHNVFSHATIVTGFRNGQPVVSYHSTNGIDVPWNRTSLAVGPRDLGDACLAVKVHIVY